MPLITSLLVFKKPLPEKVTASLSNNRLEDLRSSDRRKYSLRNWSRWWSRSASPESEENIKDVKTKIDDINVSFFFLNSLKDLILYVILYL